MRLIRKSQPWGCALTSFAMASGVSDLELIEIIGHDGSEIIAPGRHRAFHLNELIGATWSLGYSCTPLELNPTANYLIDGTLISKHVDGSESLFKRTIETTSGVLVGNTKKWGHAVAYERGRIFDPDGFEYGYGEHQFDARTLYIVEPRAKLATV